MPYVPNLYDLSQIVDRLKEAHNGFKPNICPLEAHSRSLRNQSRVLILGRTIPYRERHRRLRPHIEHYIL